MITHMIIVYWVGSVCQSKWTWQVHHFQKSITIVDLSLGHGKVPLPTARCLAFKGYKQSLWLQRTQPGQAQSPAPCGYGATGIVYRLLYSVPHPLVPISPQTRSALDISRDWALQVSKDMDISTRNKLVLSCCALGQPASLCFWSSWGQQQRAAVSVLCILLTNF